MLSNYKQYETKVESTTGSIKLAQSPDNENGKFLYFDAQPPNSNCALIYRRTPDGQYEVAVSTQTMYVWDQKTNSNIKANAIAPITSLSGRDADPKSEIINNLNKQGLSISSDNIKYVKPCFGSTQTNEIFNCSVVDATNLDTSKLNAVFVPLHQFNDLMHDRNTIKATSAAACYEILESQIIAKDKNYDPSKKAAPVKLNSLRRQKAKTQADPSKEAKLWNGDTYMSVINVDGKEVMQRRTKDSTAIICIRKNAKGEYEYMIRMQGQNLYDTKYQDKFYQQFPDTVTGSVEYSKGQTPVENTLEELNEEAGFSKIEDGKPDEPDVISEKNIVSQNTYIPSVHSNEVVHTMVVDVTGVYQPKDLKGSGDGGEEEALYQDNKWMSEKEFKKLLWVNQKKLQETVSNPNKLTSLALSSAFCDAKNYIRNREKEKEQNNFYTKKSIKINSVIVSPENKEALLKLVEGTSAKLTFTKTGVKITRPDQSFEETPYGSPNLFNKDENGNVYPIEANIFRESYNVLDEKDGILTTMKKPFPQEFQAITKDNIENLKMLERRKLSHGTSVEVKEDGVLVKYLENPKGEFHKFGDGFYLTIGKKGEAYVMPEAGFKSYRQWTKEDQAKYAPIRQHERFIEENKKHIAQNKNLINSTKEQTGSLSRTDKKVPAQSQSLGKSPKTMEEWYKLIGAPELALRGKKPTAKTFTQWPPKDWRKVAFAKGDAKHVQEKEDSIKKEENTKTVEQEKKKAKKKSAASTTRS